MGARVRTGPKKTKCPDVTYYRKGGRFPKNLKAVKFAQKEKLGPKEPSIHILPHTLI